ncbi:prepilin-type N-terminal cleavage/methylation domain-containing protein [Pseudomonas sp. ALS1279]|jgi:type IV pilus assembly protein PilW|nr:prepilin-type N-terminal cleavage/methylation domain-containing protein [Pseudomonas sp. ALS1279]TRO43972.1 prepilin-type N-terminal cleavage/methylation domain-containing protein [Pseudomonas sp. ALS1279]
MKQQQGLSLIELMIALLISSLLILGAVQLFSNTSASDRTNTAIARVQENGRVALEIIGADARRAGYQGCSSAANSLTIGTLAFPDHAVQASDKSITFNYATTENTGTAFGTNKTCDDVGLYLKSVTYSQCANGTSICMNGDPILDNSVITAIEFGVSSAGNTIWKESADISAAQLADTRSVRITLTISDARNQVSRTFANTYELRNRL